LVEISILMLKAPNRTLNPCSHYTMAQFVINLCAHKLISPRRLIPTSAIENTSNNREDTI
jgi:hypothetical protein